MQPQFQRASSLQGGAAGSPLAGSPSKRRKVDAPDTSSLPRLDQIDWSSRSPNRVKTLIVALAEPTREPKKVYGKDQYHMTLKVCDETRALVDIKLFVFTDKTNLLPQAGLSEGTVLRLEGITLDGTQAHIKLPGDGKVTVMNPVGRVGSEIERNRMHELVQWWGHSRARSGARSGALSQQFPFKTLGEFHAELVGAHPPVASSPSPHALVCRIEALVDGELRVSDGTGPPQVDRAAPQGLAPLRAILNVWPEYRDQFTPDKIGQWMVISPVKRKPTNRLLVLTLDSKSVSPMRVQWLPPGHELIPSSSASTSASVSASAGSAVAGTALEMMQQTSNNSHQIPTTLRRRDAAPMQPQGGATEECRVISKVATNYEQHQRVEIRELPDMTWTKYLEQAPPRRRDDAVVFKIVAKVTGILPGDAADLCSLACGNCGRFYNHSEVAAALAEHPSSELAPVKCPNCGVMLPPEWRFKFTLLARSHNSDAVINILVCNQEATLFLGNLAPTNLRAHPAALAVLNEYIAEMLAEQAYLEVCVRAVKHPDSSLLPELPRYRLVDTVLCPYRNLDTVLKGNPQQQQQSK